MKIIKSDKHKKVTQSVWATFKPKTQTLYKAKTRLGNSFLMWKANPVSPENHNKQLSKGLNTQFVSVTNQLVWLNLNQHQLLA